MSLVNDMLNDLEQRRSHHVDGSSANDLAYGGQGTRWQSMVNPLFVVILVAVCVSVGYFFSGMAGTAEKQSPTVNATNLQLAAASLPANVKQETNATPSLAEHTLVSQSQNEIIATQIIPVAPVAQPRFSDESKPVENVSLQTIAATSTLPVHTPTPSAGNTSLVESLLLEAEEFVLKKQFTTPPLKNAFDRYERVLVLDPHNQQAKSGLFELVERYLVLAKDTMRDNQTTQSRIYLDRAAAITARYENSFEELHIHRSAVDELRNQLLLVKTEAQPKLEPQHQPEPAIESNSAPESELLSATEVQTSEPEFKMVKREKPVDPYSQQLAQAKTLIANSEFNQALDVLESSNPSTHQMPEHFALLAALYHQLGRYQDAVNYYSRLVRNSPRSFDYWLGLAVSLDAMEDWPKALSAFESAKKLGSTDVDSMRYVNKRIQQLSGSNLSAPSLSGQALSKQG